MIGRFRKYSFSGDSHPAIIMGSCGLYNHSSVPNIIIEQDLEYERVVRTVAIKRISKNTELYLDYGWDPSE